MRGLLAPSLLGSAAVGVGLAVAVVALIWLLGSTLGQEPSPPWVCDDTRYNDTVPAGRGVAGSAVSAPPGCG